MEETEKAFIAGFLDADGSIYVRLKPNKDYRFDYQVSPYIIFFQKKEKAKILRYIKKCPGGGISPGKKGWHNRIYDWEREGYKKRNQGD